MTNLASIPTIVYVFPDPVWPYANTVNLSREGDPPKLPHGPHRPPSRRTSSVGPSMQVLYNYNDEDLVEESPLAIIPRPCHSAPNTSDRMQTRDFRGICTTTSSHRADMTRPTWLFHRPSLYTRVPVLSDCSWKLYRADPAYHHSAASTRMLYTHDKRQAPTFFSYSNSGRFRTTTRIRPSVLSNQPTENVHNVTGLPYDEPSSCSRSSRRLL